MLKIPILFKRELFAFLIAACLFTFCTPGKEAEKANRNTILSGSDKETFTITFGSCNHVDDPQDAWDAILGQSPDLWIWLGDIVYADTEDMSKMRDKYATQKMNPAYANLTDQVPVIGIWDDHDFGANNAGKEYGMKDSSKSILLNFLEVNKKNKVWSHKGIYQSYDYAMNGLLVKVILLDVRYFRDPPGEAGGSVLGQEQWDWLAQQLSSTTADIHIIAGGIQFLPEEHKYEKWFNFPGEKERLLYLIDSFKVKNPILLSGDRHFGEMMKDTTLSGQDVYEITSSGLTHSYTGLVTEANRFRLGQFINDRNFGSLRIDTHEGVITFAIHSLEGDDIIQHQIKLKH